MSIATLPNFSQRVNALQRPPIDHEIVIDSFAGFGGWGLGEELANGWAVDVAINHDPLAIAAHKVNHPATLHYQTSVFEVDPRSVEPGRKIAHCHFSPDCTHHSKARGGAPVSDRVRGLAWIVLAWMHLRRPRVVTLENVEEFRYWGPTIEKANGDRVPDPACKGETFAAFIGALSTGIPGGRKNPALKEIKKVLGHWVPITDLVKGLGYQVEFKELRACDYGAPTIRKRFFLIARCDGGQIKWPEATHGATNNDRARDSECRNHNEAMRRTNSRAGESYADAATQGQHAGKVDRCGQRSGATHRRQLKPYRTAAECIDWSLPCPSIFMTAEEAKAYYEATGIRVIRPLKQKTLERIANGIMRFVINNPQPFLISVNHGDSGGRREYPMHEPMRTVCMSGISEAVIVPFVSVYHGSQAAEDRNRRIDQPLATQDTSNRHALVAAFLNKHRGGATGSPLDEPMHTITAGQHAARPAGAAHAMGLTTATLVGCGGRAGQSRPRGIDEPAATITGKADTGIAAAHLVHLKGTCKDGQQIDEPAPTLCSGGNHVGLIATNLMHNTTGHAGGDLNDPMHTLTTGSHAMLIASFLQTYYSQGSGKTGRDIAIPAPTITTKDRVGLVTVTINNELFVIADIGMRMLQPHELLRAQFGEYADGWVLMGTKSQQVAGIGNSVCPHVARAIVKANVKIRKVSSAPGMESEAAA